jgi:hypothetical protein
MESKILIGLRRRDQIEDLLPCLDSIARPGMTVLCLMLYPVESREQSHDHCEAANSAGAAIVVGRKLSRRYSWKAQKQSAQEKILHVNEVMKQKAVSVEADLYTGNLLTTVLDRMNDYNVRWVIMPASATYRSSGLLDGIIMPFAQFGWAVLYSRIAWDATN